MRYGAIFPTVEIGSDPAKIKAYAEAVEGMGFDQLIVYDHVLGADPDRPGGWNGPYTIDTPFHEPFTLFGYLAAITSRIKLVTGILILPQRQTALVAKQAAEVDVLTGGRLVLGVGIGWNQVEYESLGIEFAHRGARMEEQVAVLRALWTQKRVDFKGRWHTIDAAGINPLPVQRPIPVWFGGSADRALQRIGRLGDGWFPNRPMNDGTKALIEQLRDYTEAAGRPRDAVQVAGRSAAVTGGPEEWATNARWWQGVGASVLTFNTMSSGFTTVDQHLEALRRVKDASSAAIGG